MVHIAKITPQLHYCGKILKQGHKYYTGTFFKKLYSGKSVCLDYKNGLLCKSVLSNGKTITKSYAYDKNKRLITVSNNGEDVFVKKIENKPGINFRRLETINDNVFRTYNEENKLIYNRIMHKAITGFFTHYHSAELKSDVVREDRYFISNLFFNGRDYYLKAERGRPVEPDLVWFKSFVRELQNNRICVMDKKDNKVFANYKDLNGKTIAQSCTLLDKNDSPICAKITGDDGSSVDLNYFPLKENGRQRIMSVLNSKYAKSAKERVYDANRNIVYERNIEPSDNGDIEHIDIFERKFDKNNLMIQEKKYKETDFGKELLYTLKREYNSFKLPEKEEFYNAKGELETSEWNVYDKKGKLRVSLYQEYGEHPESGYVVYDKNGTIRKKATLEDGFITEEYYDKNSLYIKKIIKNEDGTITDKYEFLYDAAKKNRVRTIKKDGNNNIEFTIDYYNDKGSNKEIKVYKDSYGKLIGKEFIKRDDNGYKYYYTNSKGKRCDFFEILIAVHGDINI